MALPALIISSSYASQSTFDLSVAGNTIGVPSSRQMITLLPISGLTGTGAVLALEGTGDGGLTWSAASATNSVSGATATTASADGVYKAQSGSFTYFRWRVATAASGLAAVSNGGGSTPQDVNVLNQTSGGGVAGAALDGTDATGITPPTGGVGIRGWLSGNFGLLTNILARLSGSLTVTVNPNGLGALTAVPTGSANGTPLSGSPPAGKRGARLYVPPGASISFSVAAAAPSAAPLAITVANPSSSTIPANWDEDLAGTQMIYVTAMTGAPLFRWY